MTVPRFSPVAVLALLLAAGPTDAGTQPSPGPAPTASPTSVPIEPIAPAAGCDADVDLSIAEALGRKIDDVPSLRFVRVVQAMSNTELERAAAVVDDSGLVGRLANVVVSRCRGPLAALVAARALVVASDSPGFALTSEERSALLGNLTNAAGALAVRDKLSSADVDAALAPFETTAALLAALPAAPPATCADAETYARAVKQVDPIVPWSARHDDGVVQIAVRLDAEGLMEFATLYRFTVPAGSVLQTEALAAAAASTYAAETIACKPIGGTYLFYSKFDSVKPAAPSSSSAGSG